MPDLTNLSNATIPIKLGDITLGTPVYLSLIIGVAFFVFLAFIFYLSKKND